MVSKVELPDKLQRDLARSIDLGLLIFGYSTTIFKNKTYKFLH